MDLDYKRFIILLLTFATAFYLSLNFQHSYWLIWSTFLFSLIAIGDTFTELFLVTLITIILATASSLLVNISHYFIIVVLLLTVSIQQYQPRYFFNALIISLIAIISISVTPDSYMMLLAGGIVLAFQLILWPFFLSYEMKLSQKWVIRHLRELNQEIFACFLAPHYKNNLYLYEHRIHDQTQQVLRWLDRLRHLELMKLIKSKTKENITVKFETFYANTLDFGQLRLRVTDQATFELCQKEMKTISLALNQIYRQYPKLTSAALESFNQSIKRFEENYQQVLQVASTNPVDFLLFINSMKMLHKEFSSL